MKVKIPSPLEYPEDIIKVITMGKNIAKDFSDNLLLRNLLKQSLQLLVINALPYLPPKQFSSPYERYYQYTYDLFSNVNNLFYDGRGSILENSSKFLPPLGKKHLVLYVPFYGHIGISDITDPYFGPGDGYKEICLAGWISGRPLVNNEKICSINLILEKHINSEEHSRFIPEIIHGILWFINFSYQERNETVFFLNDTLDEYEVPVWGGGFINLTTLEQGREFYLMNEYGEKYRKYTMKTNSLKERFEYALSIARTGLPICIE